MLYRQRLIKSAVRDVAVLLTHQSHWRLLNNRQDPGNTSGERKVAILAVCGQRVVWDRDSTPGRDHPPAGHLGGASMKVPT